MKKFIVLLLTLAMVMSLVACGKKNEENSETGSEEQVETTVENEDVDDVTEPEAATDEEEIPEGDPVEYGQDFWAQKYPDANICPFYINVGGVEYPYYWISSMVPEDDIASWATTDMNWNGWHMVGDKLVDKDEKHAITQESREMSFSSCCVYETEPFDASEASSAEGDNAEVEETTAYNFKGYTETADWPGEDCWTSYGLPNLVFDEDVSGIVHISDKDWIYPLNGSDGIMIEARITTPHLDELMEILNNSGVTLEEDDEYINGGYSFYYQNNGTKMKLQLAEWEIDVNDYKIQITIITDPTD